MQEHSIEGLLRWRLAQAEAEAPPPPRASRLLELAQPWWEAWPQRLRSRLEQLHRMPATLGFAQEVTPPQGHPVAAILALGEDVEAYAWVLYLRVRDGTLRMRFVLHDRAATNAEALDATFIADAGTEAPFSGRATRAPNDEYRLDVELPASLADEWEALRVTDRMPFRLILSPLPDAT